MSFPIDQSVDSTSPEHQQLKAGQRVFNGRYELKEKLGAGGMGVVWLAHDSTEKTEVALKFLPTVLVQHDREMDRLREEVRAGKELRHPLIVATYAMEVAGSLAAIVLEYVPGQSLKQKLEASACGFLEPAEVDGWLRDIASALTYLHESKQRLHRDLKPANIIIDRNGRARLMDFGISQSIQETLGRHSQTNQSHGTSNTLAYASPESLRPRHRPAIADDIYGLGATLYDLLTGTPPFYQGSPEVIALHIKTEPVPSVAERRQELVEEGMNATVGEPVPAAWEKAVASCLAKDSKDRPASANAVLTMLEPEPEPEAEPEVVPEPQVPPASPLVSPLLPSPSPPRQPAPRQSVPQAKKQSGFGMVSGLAVGLVCLAAFVLWPKAGPEDERIVMEQPTRHTASNPVVPAEPAPTVQPPTPPKTEVPKAQPVSPIDDGAVGKAISVTLPGGVEMKFCYCPPGEFTMGSPTTEEGRSDDEDQVPVQITHGYWLAQTECTQGQWEALMGKDSNPSKFTGSKSLPVEQVSLEDAQSLITKLEGVVRLPAGWTFSLPTEAQWEYACRAGSQGPWGNITKDHMGTLEDMAWYGENSGDRTHDVMTKAANAWGLYDMHGNVWEWCKDAWDGKSKLIGGRNPESQTGSYRVDRGGSWVDGGRICRSAYRGGNDPAVRNRDLGFRVAAVPTESK